MSEPCPHTHYKHELKSAQVNVTKLGFTQLYFNLSISCASCGAPFTFKAPPGFSSAQPMTDELGVLLRIPADRPVICKEEEDPEGKEEGEEEPTLH